MKKILIGAALIASAATAANAADLPRKAPVYKAPILQVYDWTGFYIGVNAGGSVGRDLTSNAINSAALFSNERTHLSPAGAIGGGQIGYNWQFRNFYNLVLGVEADIQAAGQRDSACIGGCIVGAPQLTTLNKEIDWFGTARVRAGIATGPVLTYVTAGYAYGHVTTSGVNVLAGDTIRLSSDRTRGGFVVGSGVEASIGGNWTAKIEYLYLDLSTDRLFGAAPITTFAQTSRTRDNIFRAGLNYRIGGNSGYSEPVANWSGFYLGGNAGSGIARNKSSTAFVGFPPPVTFTLVPDGYLGGVQAGYNWQAAAWVFGVEADIQGQSLRDNKACILFSGCIVTPLNNGTTGFFGNTYDQKMPWLGTVRGRIGYSVGSTLFYGTAGFAYGQTKTTLNEINLGVGPAFVANTTQRFEFKKSKGGYVVGAGIESPLKFFGLFGPNWTTKTEYLYVDLGTTRTTFTDASLLPQTFTTRTQEHIFRTGINYHFNTPVVAKY